MRNIEAIRWRLSTLIARVRFRFIGVVHGSRVRCLGQPIISRTSGSQISIGRSVVLTSRSEGTALGVRAPVILRTLTSSAEIFIAEDVGMSGTAICAAVSVRIGRRCLIGADCMIFDTDFHPHDVGGEGEPYRRHRQPDWRQISAPVTLEDDVFLGARCLVGKGVTIGRGSIVAAGSVVTRDIPPNCVAAGAPAKVVKWFAAQAVERG